MGAFKVDIPLLFRLWNSKLTNEEICLQMGCSSSMLSKLARVHKLAKRTAIRGLYNERKNDPTREEIEARAAAIRATWSPAEAMRRLGLDDSPLTVRQYHYNATDGVFSGA